MDYQAIKQALRNVQTMLDSRDYAGADLVLNSLLCNGASINDVTSNITPDAMKAFRKWHKGGRK